MKTITFTYEKKDGSKSERTLLTMIEPTANNYYAGIDLSEVEPNVAAAFAKDVAILHSDYVASLKELQIVYDLKHAYRQFLVQGMTNVTEI